jgi:hypothetical protein
VHKKLKKYNVFMALAILFAICYQSLHIFTDEAHHSHKKEHHQKTSKILLTQNTQEDCLVCDFEFAAFLSSEIFTCDFINPQHKFYFSDSYSSIVKEKEFLYFSHRGPPIV